MSLHTKWQHKTLTRSTRLSDPTQYPGRSDRAESHFYIDPDRPLVDYWPIFIMTLIPRSWLDQNSCIKGDRPICRHLICPTPPQGKLLVSL